MAEANISVAPNHLVCSVCLDLLKDPVTIPCGHSYCMVCIKGCWDQEEEKGSYSCPQCRQTFSPRPVVGRNIILVEMVEKLRMPGVDLAPSDFEEAGPGEMECTICVGRKRKANKSCLECLASYCETHFNRHEELLSGKRHKVVEAVEHLEKRVCLKHNKPLEVWCCTDQICVCPLCIIDEHKGHDIIVAATAKTDKQRVLRCSFKTEIMQRKSELQKLKQAVEPFKCTAKEALNASETIFTELIALVEKRRSDSKELIIAHEQDELSQVDELERRLEQRVIKLRQSVTELDQLSNTEDPIHFLQSLPSLLPPKDLHEITFSSHTYFGDVRTLVSQLSEHVEDSINKDFDALARNVKNIFFENVNRGDLLQHFCQPTMDVCTAFRHHDISELGTKIEWSHKVISHGDGFERFDVSRQVLCNEGLSGRHYWEVEWKAFCDIAVSYLTISRKGYGKNFGGNDLSWNLSCSNSSLVFSHNGNEIEIHGPISSRIGVYLDHKAGTLAFYSVSNQTVTLLHRVQTTFTQPLYPGFRFSSGAELRVCKKQYRFN